MTNTMPMRATNERTMSERESGSLRNSQLSIKIIMVSVEKMRVSEVTDVIDSPMVVNKYAKPGAIKPTPRKMNMSER
ncbi:MAG TPA: hypothetical protein VHP31_05985, partial [Caproicibacter sp.]|nr:hypothetical protein [Caproicibacter sp.]